MFFYYLNMSIEYGVFEYIYNIRNYFVQKILKFKNETVRIVVEVYKNIKKNIRYDLLILENVNLYKKLLLKLSEDFFTLNNFPHDF